VEARSLGLNPKENHDELMEFIELRRLLQDTKVDCVTEAGRLAILVRDVSKVLMDFGMFPTPGIPRDPRTTDNILEMVNVILEHLRDTYASSHSRWD
jgi:hypothetical protein